VYEFSTRAFLGASPLARAAVLDRHLRGAPFALLLGYLLHALVGAHPLTEASVGDRLEGSSLERVLALALFALAVVVASSRRRETAARLAASPGLLAVVGICVASALWSRYPDLTLRRSIPLGIVTFAAVAIAASARDLRALHTVLFAALTGMILLNVLAVVAAPSIAITDIGVRGIYTQKNVAGYVAMLAVLCGAAWTLGAQTRGRVVLGALGTATALIFLLVTRGKTSIGLAALALGIGGVMVLAERLGARFALFTLACALFALALAAALFAAIDFDLGRALEFAFGDASFSGRDELWVFARRAIGEAPWLGHGYGAFWDVGAVDDPLARLEPGTWLGDVETGTINQAHNGYLELSLHIGIPATIVAALTMVWGAAAATRRALARGSPRGERAAFAAMAAILWLYLAHNLTEATLFMRGAPFHALAALALAVAARTK
jgi:O-antigen ligase